MTHTREYKFFYHQGGRAISKRQGYVHIAFALLWLGMGVLCILLAPYVALWFVASFFISLKLFLQRIEVDFHQRVIRKGRKEIPLQDIEGFQLVHRNYLFIRYGTDIRVIRTNGKKVNLLSLVVRKSTASTMLEELQELAGFSHKVKNLESQMVGVFAIEQASQQPEGGVPESSAALQAEDAGIESSATLKPNGTRQKSNIKVALLLVMVVMVLLGGGVYLFYWNMAKAIAESEPETNSVEFTTSEGPVHIKPAPTAESSESATVQEDGALESASIEPTHQAPETIDQAMLKALEQAESALFQDNPYMVYYALEGYASEYIQDSYGNVVLVLAGPDMPTERFYQIDGTYTLYEQGDSYVYENSSSATHEVIAEVEKLFDTFGQDLGSEYLRITSDMIAGGSEVYSWTSEEHDRMYTVEEVYEDGSSYTASCSQEGTFFEVTTDTAFFELVVIDSNNARIEPPSEEDIQAWSAEW